MMCMVCGCGEGGIRIEGHGHSHDREQGHHPGHDHDRHYHNRHEHTHDYGQGPAHAHAPGLSQARMVQVEEDILGKNNQYAAANRLRLAELGILALNLVSSPGSGKTALLTRTLDDLKDALKLSVIEGDQQTANDAERVRDTGVKACSRKRRACCSSRTWATWCARRHSIWERPTRS